MQVVTTKPQQDIIGFRCFMNARQAENALTRSMVPSRSSIVGL